MGLHTPSFQESPLPLGEKECPDSIVLPHKRERPDCV
jgi:hypothetical protein